PSLLSISSLRKHVGLHPSRADSVAIQIQACSTLPASPARLLPCFRRPCAPGQHAPESIAGSRPPPNPRAAAHRPQFFSPHIRSRLCAPQARFAPCFWVAEAVRPSYAKRASVFFLAFLVLLSLSLRLLRAPAVSNPPPRPFRLSSAPSPVIIPLPFPA